MTNQATHEQTVYRHRHNSLIGKVCLIKTSLLILTQEPSLTPKARALVEEILTNAGTTIDALNIELRTFRLDPDGIICKMQHDEHSTTEQRCKRRRRGIGSY